jgi:hypothetical protein
VVMVAAITGGKWYIWNVNIDVCVEALQAGWVVGKTPGMGSPTGRRVATNRHVHGTWNGGLQQGDDNSSFFSREKKKSLSYP